MKLLGFDSESTGLNIKEDVFTEVAGILYDTVSGEILKFYNTLVWSPHKKGNYIPDETIELNGITTDMVLNYGINTYAALGELGILCEQCDFVVAHNGTNFDRPLLNSELERCSKFVDKKQFEKPWIDTAIDIPYPSEISTRKLTHLASEHGFVNPFPHRAFADVLTMFEILKNYDIEEIARRSQLQSFKLTALGGFPVKDKAKAAGFRYNADKKEWTRIVKEDELEGVKAKLDFAVKEEFL